MKPPALPSAIPYRDLWRIFKRAGRCIALSALTCGCIALLYALVRPTWYRSHAIFREKVHSSQKSLMQSDGLLSSLVSGGASSSSQQDFYSLIRSRRVLQPAISTAGLQVRLRPLLSPIFLLLHLTDNLRIEARYWIELFDPETSFEPFFPQSLRAQNVHYEGETTLWYTLSFLSDTNYQLHDSEGNHLGSGVLGEPFSHPLFTLTFCADPAAPLSGMRYRIKLVSIEKAVERCQSHVTMRAVKEREKLFQLTFYHPNRIVVSTFLNSLMLSYQNDHIEEAKQLTEKERLLWEEKQREALYHLESSMRTYAHSGRALIEKTGFLDPEKQLNFLLTTQQRLLTRHEQLLQEEARCAHALALPFYSPMVLLLPAQNMPEELKVIIRNYLKDDTERKTLLELLKSRTADNAKTPTNMLFSGLDLPAAHAKMDHLQHKHHEIERLITQHELFLEQLSDATFPLGSVLEMFEDPTSREMALLARALQGKLHDKENYLEKDRLHIQHALKLQREDAQEHFSHRLTSLQRQHQEINQQIYLLRQETFMLLTDRLKSHEKEIKTAFTDLLTSLVQEKEQLNRELLELQESLSHLPALWATQQMEQTSLTLQKSALKQRSKWMESYLAMHLHDLLLSGPVDFAIPPLFPSYPGVLLYTLLGLLCGAFPAACYALIQARKRGLPASPQLLQLMGQHVIGTLSTLPAHNKELLRHLTCDMLHARERTLWVFFLEENMQDIESTLLELLEAEGKRVFVEKSPYFGRAEEEPEPLIERLHGHTKDREKNGQEAPLTLIFTHIPPTSGRALQLIRHAHGVIIFLTEEHVTTIELAPLWNATHNHSLFFLFIPIVIEARTSPLVRMWNDLRLTIRKRIEALSP